MSSYDFIMFVLMIIMFVAAVGQLFQARITGLGIIAVISGLAFAGYTGFHGDLDMLSVILFITGIILLILELFVVGAVLGILGAIMVISSFLLIGDDIGKMSLLVSLVLLIVFLEWVIIVKFFKRKIPLFNQVILTDSTSKEAGYTSHDDRSHLIGQTAITNTPLRPSGMINFGDDRIDAVSDGPFIDRGKEVTIIHVEGTRVVVREKI